MIPYEPVIRRVPAPAGRYRGAHAASEGPTLTASLAIGAILLAGMAAAAGYAAARLPAGARVPLHAGNPERSLWLPKRAGLAAWPGIGAAAFAVVAAVTTGGTADGWSPSLRVVLLPSVMCVALAAEAAAIISAGRRAGAPAAGAPAAAGNPGTRAAAAESAGAAAESR